VPDESGNYKTRRRGCTIPHPTEIATPSARNDTLRGNPKQIPVSKFKVQNRLGHLDFGHLILFSISDLVFGILPFALSFCILIFAF
jgi:hypothetical protein